MTPKDALEYLENRVSKLAINHKIGNRDIANLEIKDIVTGIETHVIPTIEKVLTDLEKYLTTPTADDVCEALSDYCKKTVYYTNLDFDIERGFVIQWYKEVKSVRDIKLVSGTKDRLHFYKELPPHLINLISRFYMGQTE